MRSDIYQAVLIISLAVCAVLGGIFYFNEVYPQYKIFQNAYVELENFRSTYTGEPPPPFKFGVKQIVLLREDKGPEVIDRCTSCHVALIFPHFSPTKIAFDVNGKAEVDENGNPVLVPNENYVWLKLDEKIASLRDEKFNQDLIKQGKESVVKDRLKRADEMASWKTAEIDGRTIDMTRVLAMHPLIGRETRPFEYHPEDQYGCTSCHSGNGRGLVMDKAHGPIYDDEYEPEHEGIKPIFTEPDPKNDPKFSRVFNHKPNYHLLFQTTPLFVGSVIEAKCVQCHQPTNTAFQGIFNRVESLTGKKSQEVEEIEKGQKNDIQALASLIDLKKKIQSQGYAETVNQLMKLSKEYSLSQQTLAEVSGQISFLSDLDQKAALQKIDLALGKLAGSPQLAEELNKELVEGKADNKTVLNFYSQHEGKASGSIFEKAATLNMQKELMQHVVRAENSFQSAVADDNAISAISSDIDMLTKTYQRGQQLFISQACYACHRITGFTRGGVGPELTKSGYSYPWFVKQSIVWPQADLKTSTMPNFKMDHEEVEALVTFVLAQTGQNKSVSDYQYQSRVKEWEAGSKQPWEKPLPPDKIHDVRNSMIIFATEGCASCHRLRGFESDVGYKIEVGETKPDFETMYKEKQWFRTLFPEEIIGSKIVETIESHFEEIDQRIVANVRQGSILEEIEKIDPRIIESFYSNFKYALRAKNSEFQEKAAQENDPVKKQKIMDQLEQWKQRVDHVLMVYIQEYGLGRLICPRLNWSGVFRSDKWLMDHFFNPTQETPKSIMPVFPFDETKFYALTYMLDVLGKKDRDEDHLIWQHRGFNPEAAYEKYCSQCHGDHRRGNGPVSEWIYPIPKNLTNSNFLRSLTKERAIQSITHGVKGTPMPPWGEVAYKNDNDQTPIFSQKQIEQIVDWLFFDLSGSQIIEGEQDVLKWQYNAQDVLKELHKEGGKLKSDSDELFEVEPAILPGPEKHSYFIKKKYYTQANIAAGKQLFEENCAACHGKEADGTGLRAETMLEAKPRMLTNLNWLSTRDDLRLLRSIKYGVPGTAMTPWGDMTSALQRLQLVMYIRSLSSENNVRAELLGALYDTFEDSGLAVDDARAIEYKEIDALEKKVKQLKLEQETLSEESDKEVRIKNYEERIELEKQLKERNQVDQILIELRQKIDKESEYYRSIGLSMIAAKVDEKDIQSFLKMLELHGRTFEFKDSNLVLKTNEIHKDEIEQLKKNILSHIESTMQELEKKKILTGAKLPSAEKNEMQTQEMNEFKTLEKLRATFISELSEADRVKIEQEKLYHQFEEKTKIKS